MTQAHKDGIKAVTAKIRDNANEPIPADIIANCDSIDEKIDAEPITKE